MSGPPHDPWFRLAARTPARIGLGRAGASLPTREVLSFALAHARARDAVHTRLDRTALAQRLAAIGLPSLEVESEACDRQVYLRRPDLGRKLLAGAHTKLEGIRASGVDLAIVVGDGLSAGAVMTHAPALLEAVLPLAAAQRWTLSPVVIAEGARVALGDEIGECLGARIAIVLIGERPGLSAADSLGIYMTYAPKIGRSDAERNCISNVRPEGLTPRLAAARLAWLIDAALNRRLTGVALKDESDAALPVTAGVQRLAD